MNIQIQLNVAINSDSLYLHHLKITLFSNSLIICPSKAFTILDATEV